MYPLKLFFLVAVLSVSGLCFAEEKKKQERIAEPEAKAYVESVQEVQRLQKELAYARQILNLRVENMKLKYKLGEQDQVLSDGKIIRATKPEKPKSVPPKKEE